MKILGVSCLFHDSAACVVVDGVIVAAAQEERFTRKKFDARFPSSSIHACLKQADLTLADIDIVAFYEKPILKFERLLETYLAFAPRGLRQFLASLPVWMRQKLWLGEMIRRQLPGFNGKLYYVRHHDSHAASAFFPSPFPRAAIIVFDAVGEWHTTTVGLGEGNRIGLRKELNFPHSLGMLYSAFTYYTGFRVNSGEYKLMGLAPYGEPRHVQVIYDHLIDLKQDGSFRLNMAYFDFATGFTMTNDRFHRLFGRPPRVPESPLTELDMDLAASIQAVTEEVIFRIARYAKEETGAEYLCLAGGVALNCVANGKLLKSGLYKDIWVQPACGDAGGALGAALYAWYQYGGRERRVDPAAFDAQKGSLLGPGFSNSEIERWLKANGVAYARCESESALLDEVSSLLADGKVVGWFCGRMEFGPRALGNRSILGDSWRPEMQSVMNLKIKFRESFRPFAPSVLEERASEYFEIDRPSPYMLFTFPVTAAHREAVPVDLRGLERLKASRSSIPAVTHVDYSARIQTVNEAVNGRYYRLIKRFAEKTGCPMVINTSFNVRGEPIVCTPEDAFRCFMHTGIDYLVLEDCIIDRGNQRDFPPLPKPSLELD